MKGNHRRQTTLATLLGLGIVTAPTQAEDIEVFFSSPAESVAPNVLFVLDSSKSMDSSEGSDTRMGVLKDSLNKVLKPQEPYKKLNVGIMDFSGNRSGGIDFPITDINSDASLVDGDIPANTDVGTILDYIAKSYEPFGETPMGDALFFASSYYKGEAISNRRNNQQPPKWDDGDKEYKYPDSRLADHRATYDPAVTFSWRPTEILCSTNWYARPPGYTSCGSNPHSCGPELTMTKTIPERPKRYRIRTYSCDSSGLECSWSWAQWREIDAAYPGDSSCGSPENPQDGDIRVDCEEAAPAYTETHNYKLCKTSEKVWDPSPAYHSPITHQCQSNYIVMLTDGEPTKHDRLQDIASRVHPITGTNSAQGCADLSAYAGTSGKIPENGRCLPELVEYMATEDQAPAIADKQTITTYTIGFKLTGNPAAQDFLQLLASKGNGDYFDANSPDDLTNVFKQIIRDVTGGDISFATPSVSVDQNNRLATSKYLYRPEFTPSDKPSWKGDIIRTELGYDNSGNPVFTDDPTTFASTLEADQRQIYTYAGNNDDLIHASNAFTTGNAYLTAARLGLSNSTDRDKLIQWARGIDVNDEDEDNDTTDQRKHMGDSLHTTPALVNYPSGSGYSQVLYVPTNDGFLHAFDISSGTPQELFAFIPPELLSNLDILYRNNNADDKVYGLDGNITIWQSDDHVYLYFGMRRGGRNYYALDVTDPAQPKFLWRIRGGVDDGFEELGQTWSTPQLTSVKTQGTETRALIFAGGYDTDQDNQTTNSERTADDLGRAIFIVDAETGDKIWSAGPEGHDLILPLSNSIPSDVRIIDLDGNGLSDRLYVGDMGGRIWRIDLDQADIHNSSGYLLADLAEDNSAKDNRRFYYPPSIAFDRQFRLRVAIGSGYRARPTETVTEDRFYVFEDKDAKLGPPDASRPPVTEADLDDITNKTALSGTQPGWYLRLNEGEKVLAESVIFNGKVTFTSYQPDFQSGNDTCNLSGNIPRAYMLALEDGRAVANLDNNSQGDNTRYMELASVQFIPSSPYITFNPNGSGGNNGAGSGDGNDDDNGNSDGGSGDGTGGGTPAPPPCATLFVGQDALDTDCSLSRRIAWQNR